MFLCLFMFSKVLVCLTHNGETQKVWTVWKALEITLNTHACKHKQGVSGASPPRHAALLHPFLELSDPLCPDPVFQSRIWSSLARGHWLLKIEKHLGDWIKKGGSQANTSTQCSTVLCNAPQVHFRCFSIETSPPTWPFLGEASALSSAKLRTASTS